MSVCLHSRKAEDCQTWYCQYPKLIAEHGHVKQTVSGLVNRRMLCEATFEDGHKVYTIESVIVPQSEFESFKNDSPVFREMR